MMWRCDEIVTFVPSSRKLITFLEGGLPPSQHRRRSIVFRVSFQRTNKQTNKWDPETEAGSHCQADMPDLNCIPPDQHDQDWALLRGVVITLIDEVKNSDASTDVNDSIEDVNDFFVTGPATAAVNSIDLSSAGIADREIKILKRYGRLAPFPFPRTRILSTSGVAVLCIFQVSLAWVCWRGVYLLFLQLQQLMSACFQQRVTCWLRNVHVIIKRDNVVYWKTKRKIKNDLNIIITFNVFSCLLFIDSETPSEWLWLWLMPAVSRLSFCFSIHTHTHTHIVTIIGYYISWYWQNRHWPEFQLKRLLVPVTQSWHFTDTGPRTGLYH